MPLKSQKALREIDQASCQVGALCELLAAAEEKQISAACLYSMLEPIARKLDHAAGVIADKFTADPQ